MKVHEGMIDAITDSKNSQNVCSKQSIQTNS